MPIALASLTIEAFRYYGYLSRYGINISLVVLASLLIGLTAFFRATTHPTIRLLYSLLPLGLAAITFILAIFTATEIHKGVGHIRTEFGIDLSTVFVITVYMAMLLVLPLVRDKLRTLPKKIFWKTIALTVVLVYVYFFRIQKMYELVIARASRAEDLLFMSESQRVGSLWSHAAALLYFVAQNTPENAVILHPIQDYPWPETGNQYVVRRFLYPRTLIAPEWGKGNPTHVIIDDGSPNHQLYADKLDRIGWPFDIFPSNNVLLMNPWKKHIAVQSVTAGQKIAPLQATKDDGVFDGKLEIQNTFESTTIDAVFTRLQYALVALSPSIPVSSAEQYSIDIETSEAFIVAPVAIISNPQTNERWYLYYTPNPVAGRQTLIVADIQQRLMKLLSTDKHHAGGNYQVTIALDVGYTKPMPFMYGKGIINLVQPSDVDNANECVVATNCLYAFEQAIYSKRFSEAEQLIPRLEALLPDHPYFNYLAYLTLRQQGRPETEYLPYLQHASTRWSSDDTYNLPKLILRTHSSSATHTKSEGEKP